ncbi:sperm flagellar protein 2 isoform X3 [Mobula birostris]|uniref:sperm flagellar protein 2 isoform X3 n=1 Tax=Mobula birostris TaxID=1983395 RepID=UPI003B28225E
MLPGLGTMPYENRLSELGLFTLERRRMREPRTFAKEFSTGYLIGEILNKHQLQEDFDQFSQGRNAVSQLNNFQRLLPTLQLLGVMFSDNVVKALIEEQHGVATRLLYQIYIALRRKEKAQLSKMAMETMRPPAAAKLASISAEMYKERMKSMIPREIDMALQRVSDRYIAKGKEVEEEAALKDEQELQKQQSIQEEQQTQHLEMLHKAKRQNKELMEKVQGSIIPVSKKMPREMENTSLKRKQELRKKEAEMFNNEITKFEKILKNLTPAGGEEESESSLNLPGRAGPPHVLSSPCTRVQEGQSFIENVRTRLKEDRRARREREKRRRRVMLELLEAHEAQEEVYREEELVNRLMRQSLQERRVTVQLVHARHEKHVMEQNRFFREKQYEEQRLKEFRQALDREEILARQERVEQGERMEQEREVHEQLMVERAERRYRKYYHLCQEVVTHILDLVTKVAEYRELCVGLIPNKLMREWKELFFTQMPIYDQPDAQLEASGERAVDSIEQAKMHLLNSQDYEDYQLMTGEWQPPVDGDIHGPPPDNNVLGHVVNRITEIAHPAKETSPPPQFPPFPIKACILGKLHAGKTTCLKHLAEALNIRAISPETLVQEAVQAFSAGETADPGVSQEHGADTQTVAGSPDPAQQQAENSGVSHGHNGEKGAVQDLLHDPSMDHFEPPTPGSGANQQPAPETQEEWKEVPEAQTRTSAKQESQPSARAQLGERAAKFLRKGKSVPDDLLTEMVNECLRRLPAGCGWILDGFPATITQAKLLEKLLTGVDPDYTVPKTKRSRTKMAVDPKASKQPLPPQPALDIAILLEVSDNTVLVRHLHNNVGQCAEAMIQKTSGEQGPQEILDVGGNMSPTEEQLLPRLTGFLEHWPKLEKWFTGQQILAKVNGELQQAELLEKLELVLVESLLKKHSRDAVTEKPPGETTPALAETSPSQGRQETSPKDVDLVGSGSVSVPSSAKEKIKVSLGDKKQNKSASISQADTMSKQSSAKGKSGSAKGKKGKEQKAKAELYPSEIAGETDDALPPAPKPGSDQWVYVDEPVPQEIVEYLCHYWDSIVETYTSTIRRVMQELRREQQRAIQDLHTLRNDFWEYMESRPDHKQAFVSQWQDDYNSIPDDQRGDDDVKAELMLRLYTLRECLWDISDKRKEEAEQERQNAMGNGWLQDHLGILLNLYSTLMQVEVDRFQDTSRFLQDYYKGMEGKIPLDSSKEFARIPLVNVADVQLPALGGPNIVSVSISSLSDGQRKPNSPGSSSNALKDGELIGGQELKQLRTPDSDGRGKPETGSPGSRGKAEQEGEWEGVQEMKEFRVPLVPYRIPSSSVIVKEKSKLPVKVTGKAKEEVVVTDAPSFTDIDEYLISEAYHTAVSALSNIIQREVKLKEDEEKKEQKLKQDKEKDQPKSSAGKDRKKKSAEKKKGLRSTTPVLPALVENPQEVSRREHIYTEYFGALQDEAAAVTTRLALIKLKALMTIQDLKSKAGDLFTTMEDWLGIQFLQEMNSIAALLAVGLQHVQTGTKILFPLVLGSQEFFINGDLKLIPDPPPPPHLPPKERPKVGEFTVQQLQDLVQHFSLLSPTGFMTRRGFIETLQGLISQDLGSDNLPEPWCSLTYPQLVEISRVLAPDSDFLDWRQFVLSIAQPWPYPSLRDLLDAKIRFQAVDQADSGYITKEQYDQVELWFTGHADQQDPEDPLEPIPFNRLAQLKEVFFGLFVEDGPSEPRLDYNNTLLYFSRHQDPAQGLHRALSITVGSALPWAPLSSPQKSEQYVPQHVPGGPPAPGLVEKVPLSALFQVMTHGVAGIGETHRQWSPEAGRHRQCQLFTQVYKELGSKELEPVPFDVLLKHPVIMDLITNTTRFSKSDVHAVIQRQFLDGEAVASSSPEPASSPADEPGQAQSRLKMSRL